MWGQGSCSVLVKAVLYPTQVEGQIVWVRFPEVPMRLKSRCAGNQAEGSCKQRRALWSQSEASGSKCQGEAVWISRSGGDHCRGCLLCSRDEGPGMGVEGSGTLRYVSD